MFFKTNKLHRCPPTLITLRHKDRFWERNGRAGALDTVDTVDTVDTLDTVDTVDTVDALIAAFFIRGMVPVQRML